MLILTAILLLLLGIALGLAHRPWWELGVLTLLAWGSLQVVDAWIGNWRDQVGLPGGERLFEPQTVAWLLVGAGAYVNYGLALLYSRRRLSPRKESDPDIS